MNFKKSWQFGLIALVAFGLALTSGGCGGGDDKTTAPEIVNAQQSASQQWQTAKSNGDINTKSTSAKPSSSGNQGHTLGPGGAN